MNINNIFRAFNDDFEDEETEMLIDFSEHPFYWIGGFNKIIGNHAFFSKYTSKVFKNISKSFKIAADVSSQEDSIPSIIVCAAKRFLNLQLKEWRNY